MEGSGEFNTRLDLQISWSGGKKKPDGMKSLLIAKHIHNNMSETF